MHLCCVALCFINSLTHCLRLHYWLCFIPRSPIPSITWYLGINCKTYLVQWSNAYRLIVVAFLNQRSFTDSGRVVVSSLSHYYAASLYKDILTLFPNRIFVLCDVCVVALGDILLGALGLLLLLHLLLLLLPHNTNCSGSILYTIREVYSCILVQDV